MNELESNKSNMILTMLYKTTCFLCWYLFGILFMFFIQGEITDSKVLILVLLLIVTYGIRNFFKYLYKGLAETSYYNTKHAIEMNYFKKALNLKFKDIENTDLNELSDEVLTVSYRYTKFIYDMGEIIIPCILGIMILFVPLAGISPIISILVLCLLSYLIYYKYNKLSENDVVPNIENKMLKDFINKLFTIRILNIKDYVINKLDNSKDNSIGLNDKNNENDIIFQNGLLAILSVILLSVLLFVNVTIDKVGLILFFLIMSFKLQYLLNRVAYAIKNYMLYKQDKFKLDSKFNNEEELKYRKRWNSIHIKDGKVKYESGITIKIPTFELNTSDTVSIMGKSGEGKSTLINVLSGISSLDEGSLFYDEEITNEIVNAVYVSNSAKLFNISLKDNLLLNKEYTDEELVELIKEVGLSDWYNKLDNGLNTILDDTIDDIVLLKLTLLRGIIMDKDTYFLDNPTDGMDLDEEKQVVALIKKKLKKKTVIIVTGRPILTNICKKHFFIKDHTLLENEPLL